MANVGLTEYLMEFGLTRQEATIYLNLMERGMQTGYEVSKQTGISRSNVYRALARSGRKRSCLYIGRKCHQVHGNRCRGILQ